MSNFNNKYYVHQARIFDGHKLIKLNYYKIYNIGYRQYLPKDFAIIENNVPINYWSDSDYTFIDEHKIIHNKYYPAPYYKNPFNFDIVRINIKLNQINVLLNFHLIILLILSYIINTILMLNI
jgi:hypothetical protein